MTSSGELNTLNYYTVKGSGLGLSPVAENTFCRKTFIKSQNFKTYPTKTELSKPESLIMSEQKEINKHQG